MNNHFKPTIMIDLDGVLNEYTQYTEEIPPIKSGAKIFLQKLLKECNFELILFTTRNLQQARFWLKKNDIEHFFKNVTNKKLPAFLYLDDRAINFNGDFDKALKNIKEFKPYWKNT